MYTKRVLVSSGLWVYDSNQNKLDPSFLKKKKQKERMRGKKSNLH